MPDTLETGMTFEDAGKLTFDADTASMSFGQVQGDSYDTRNNFRCLRPKPVERTAFNNTPTSVSRQA
jgi:hypothetical protein